MTTTNGALFRLHLFRHAHAAWPDAGRSDFDRKLDMRGRFEAHYVAKKAKEAGIRPEWIVSSPASRCEETALVFRETAGGLPVSFDEGLYSGLDAYLEQIDRNRERESLMLVGHNPMIEGLATMLTAPGGFAHELDWGYPTAGLLTLEFDRPLPFDLQHKGRLAQLLVPDLT